MESGLDEKLFISLGEAGGVLKTIRLFYPELDLNRERLRSFYYGTLLQLGYSEKEASDWIEFFRNASK